MSLIRKLKLSVVPEVDIYDIFDHTQTLRLGFPEPCIVFEKTSYQPYILQCCKKEEFTAAKRRLTEIAKTNDFFITTRHIFPHADSYYIASDVADICLANIINCLILMTEA